MLNGMLDILPGTPLLLKMTITTDVADEIINDVAEVVSNLDQEDEQTEDSVGLIADVFSDIGNLIQDGDFNVSETVSGWEGIVQLVLV